MYAYIDSNGNKGILSGILDIPQYTMAQYTALSVKPEYWICTDYDSSSVYGIDSANVKYGNTSVEQAIDDRQKDYTLLSSGSGNSVNVNIPNGAKEIRICASAKSGNNWLAFDHSILIDSLSSTSEYHPLGHYSVSGDNSSCVIYMNNATISTCGFYINGTAQTPYWKVYYR